jgi:hypothetical protein
MGKYKSSAKLLYIRESSEEESYKSQNNKETSMVREKKNNQRLSKTDLK